jgi:hypothetical protein
MVDPSLAAARHFQKVLGNLSWIAVAANLASLTVNIMATRRMRRLSKMLQGHCHEMTERLRKVNELIAHLSPYEVTKALQAVEIDVTLHDLEQDDES